MMINLVKAFLLAAVPRIKLPQEVCTRTIYFSVAGNYQVFSLLYKEYSFFAKGESVFFKAVF